MSGKNTSNNTAAGAEDGPEKSYDLAESVDRLFLAIALAGDVVSEEAVEPFMPSADETCHDLRQRLLAAGVIEKDEVDRFEILLGKVLLDHPHPLSFIRLRLDRVLGDLGPKIGRANVRRFLFGESDAPDMTRTGEVLYRFLEPLGRGGQGEVWRGLDEQLGRIVALKRMADASSDDHDRRQRFLREARITGGLEHPSIAPIYSLDPGDADRAPCYAMRLLQGRRLTDVIAEFHQREGQIDADRQTFIAYLEIFIKICDGVRFSHEHGVVHRDLKPSNVMVGEFGEVSIIDWGLAKSRKAGVSNVTPINSKQSGIWPDDPARTQAGRVIGSPLYLSPEQARGEVESQDERTDIFGLGSVLYEMLCGEAPRHYLHGLDVHAVLAHAASEPVPPLHQRRSGIPPALAAICSHAMNLDPKDRYATVDELTRDLRRFVSDAPVSVYQESLLRRTSRWMYHHRHIAKWVGAGIAIAALVGILLVGYAVASFQSVVADRLNSFKENFDDLSRTIHLNAVLVSDRTQIIGELPAISQYLAEKGTKLEQLDPGDIANRILKPFNWTCRAYVVKMPSDDPSDWITTTLKLPYEQCFVEIEPLLSVPSPSEILAAAEGAKRLQPDEVFASPIHAGPDQGDGRSMAGVVYTAVPILLDGRCAGAVVLQSLFGVEPVTSIEVEPPSNSRDIFLANPEGVLLVSQFSQPGSEGDQFEKLPCLDQLFPETAALCQGTDPGDLPLELPRTTRGNKILFANYVSIDNWTPRRRLILAFSRSYSACIDQAKERLLRTTSVILIDVAVGASIVVAFLLVLRIRKLLLGRRGTRPRVRPTVSPEKN